MHSRYRYNNDKARGDTPDYTNHLPTPARRGCRGKGRLNICNGRGTVAPSVSESPSSLKKLYLAEQLTCKQRARYCSAVRATSNPLG